MDIVQAFGLQGQQRISCFKAICTEACITYVSGLLLHQLESIRGDRIRLRDAVMEGLGHLKKLGIPPNRMHKALHVQAERARCLK